MICLHEKTSGTVHCRKCGEDVTAYWYHLAHARLEELKILEKENTRLRSIIDGLPQVKNVDDGPDPEPFI